MNNEDLLKEITRKYWERTSSLDARLKWYITEPVLEGQSLLQAELAYARSKDRLPKQPCQTLVLLVGHSLEPLLQAVCGYQPSKVILLLNEKPYSMGKSKKPKKWHAYAMHLVEAIEHLAEHGLLEQMPDIPGQDGKQGYPVADDPKNVFRKLIDILRNEQDVVIDITGGKKSMVSGAYLYAAYAGMRISYVDFEEYDPEYRRPYGFTCKIGSITNPYEVYALREWERVQDLYERYQFREARQIVKNEILQALQQWTPEAKGATEQLVRVLEFYELWDSGNYRAAQEYPDLPEGFEQPTAVSSLGEKWFAFQEGVILQKPHHLYGDKEKVKVYACDELARIERLIRYNEDYRSAFLRAAGLNEVILVARLAEYANESIKETLLDALDLETPSASKLFQSLGNNNSSFSWNFHKPATREQFGNTLSVQLTQHMNAWWVSTPYPNWKSFLDHRNQLAHTYFSVPREWAENALRFVKANIEDFWGQSVETMGVNTEALPWGKLCDLTGVSQFLPPNLRNREV